MMSESLVHINEHRVRQLLDWDLVVSAVEDALRAVAENRAIQNPRSFTFIPNTDNVLLCMPGYLGNGNNSVLATKLVTSFLGNEKMNPPLPSIFANIFLFDTTTGQLKCIMEANEITAWRTAAASVVATKYLHEAVPGKKNDILAIIGAGRQGRIHAIAFHNIFKFKQIRVWNRTSARAENLVAELKTMGISVMVALSAEECVKDADVIVTATYTSTPFVNLSMVKPNVHINAIGAGQNHTSELSEDIYRKSVIYVDYMEGANAELKSLSEIGIPLEGILGKVIVNKELRPNGRNITIYQSLGMASEDAAVGQLIYERHLNTKNN